MEFFKLQCAFQRTYRGGAPYLITLFVMDHFHCVRPSSSCPQARAVMDDFGFLTIVGGWY